MHDTMPTESTFHLFFRCAFAIKLWSWFATILNVTLQFNTIDDIWRIYNRQWTPHAK